MKKILHTFLLLMLVVQVQGQNVYRFTNYNFLKNLYNPAALGSDASITADLVYGGQWYGIEGAPQTMAANASYDITDDMAIGLTFNTDKVGLYQNNSFSAQYAYRIMFDDRKYLAFGLGLGADQVSWNLAEASTTQANDPVFAGSTTKFIFQGSFGAYYRTERFYAGLSLPQLFNTNFSYSEKGIRIDRWAIYSLIGYYYEVSDRFLFNPSAQIKMMRNAPVQFDAQLRAVFSPVGISAGYRSDNTIIAGLDCILFNRIRVGYMGGYNLGRLSSVKGFSHEVSLGMGLPYYFNKKNQRIINKKGGFSRNFRKRAGRRH
ncbi:MAG: PorP/SprF family type IX secretion system membrane protein [Bacteroidota bacterium]